MARSLPLVTVLVVVFFLALVPAPLVSGRVPIAAIGKIGRYSARLRPDVTKARNFLGKHSGDIWGVFQEILQAPSAADKKGADDDKPESAANTAGLYIFNLSVGKPAQNVAGVLDVTLSFVWAQCEPCTSCLPAPSFQGKASSTFANVPCSSQTCQQSVLKQECPRVASGGFTFGGCGYTVVYGVGMNTTGYLANDTFTFGGPTSRVDVLFGCSYASSGDFSGASGSFGFGRGPLSLTSQLQLSWFSYFLASDGSGISGGGGGNLLQFGDDDAVPRSSRGRSTPLVRSSKYPDRYYVTLKSIQVDGRDLTGIPAGTFDFQADGSGGVFLSTTMPATYLEEAAYKVVRQAFVSGIASVPVDGRALGLDLCYAMPSNDKQLKVPKLTLVFDGTATMELKKRNYFFADSETGLQCLAIMPSRGASVLGSLLQTDTNMTYDIRGEQLVFETAFAPPRHSKVSVSLMVLATLVAWVLLF